MQLLRNPSTKAGRVSQSHTGLETKLDEGFFDALSQFPPVHRISNRLVQRVLLLFLSWLFTRYTGCIFLWGFHAKQITKHVPTWSCMHAHTCTHPHPPTQKNCLNIHTHMISVSQHSSCAYLSLITFKAGVHLMVSEMK